MGLLCLERVKKHYVIGEETVRAVNDVSLEINESEFVSIIGPSGSGKSTLLNLMGCIDTPTEGSVKINGACTLGMSDNELSSLRGDYIGFIFQSFNLINVFNVFENIEYPLIINKKKTSGTRDRVNEIIDRVGLAQFKNHVPNQLSGGQRQRVAIARALVLQPRMVLADEPTANLDSRTSEEIIELMHEMKDQYKTTFIFSTHDPDVVRHANKTYELRDGQLR